MTASTSDFAHIIRTFRLQAGLSQEELAERAGVSARAVSDMERGLRKSPRPETLRLLAEALALDATERVRFFAAAHPAPDESPRSGQRQAQEPAEKPTAIPLATRPLPQPLDTLIGRDDDIEAIVSLLESAPVRLVTLTGPGGVGKTRLSLAVGTRLMSSFAEGVVFIDLAPLTAPDQVGPAIAGALGLDLDARLSISDALVATLRYRTLLLVFDNFEHLLGAAPLLTDVLLGCVRLKILATSRVRLRLRGEQVFQVAPLPVPAESDAEERLPETLLETASIELFVDRARQAHYGFTLDAQNAGAVVEICRRLDGLPLAIELAAARVGMLPPEAILDRLAHLGGGSRDAPNRQQTLRDAIAWSYDLLAPADQTVFRRLSVFAGGFTLAAAEEVTREDAIAVSDAIELLAESNLLAPMSTIEGEPRFTMLETVHSYAAERLDQSGEADLIRRRHADWCIGLVETAGRDLIYCRNVPSWYRTLDEELANFRSAIAFMFAADDSAGVVRIFSDYGGYWNDRPYLREVQRWLQWALPLAGQVSDESKIYGHFLFVFASVGLGNLERANALATHFLDWAEKIATPYALGMGYFTQGFVAENLGDIERAIDSHLRASRYLWETGQTAWILQSKAELGINRLYAGQIDQAAETLEEGVALSREAHGDAELAYGLTYLGLALLAQDLPARAVLTLDEALSRAQSLRMDRLSLSAIGGLAGVAATLGQPESAARLLGAIASARQSSGIERIVAAAHIDGIAARVESVLGPERYASLHLDGSRMVFADVVASAHRIAAETEQRSDQPAGEP